MSKKRERSDSLFNVVLNHNMQKNAYLLPQYEKLTQNEFSERLASRFPGLTKKKLKDLLDNFKENGLNNRYSVQALQLYCDLLQQSPQDALSEHQLFPANSVTFELFTWKDIERLDQALSARAASFFYDYRDDLPIQIPIKYSPKDMVLLYLELYEGPGAHLELDFRVSCYANSWSSNPSLDYLVETEEKKRKMVGLLPGQGQASVELRRRYDSACEDFTKMCNSTASLDSFGRINDVVFDILDKDILLLEGSFSAFRSPEYFEMEEQTPTHQKQAFEQPVDRDDDNR